MESYGEILSKSKVLSEIFSQNFIKTKLSQLVKEKCLNQSEILYLKHTADNNLYFLQQGEIEVYMDQTIIQQSKKIIKGKHTKINDP